MKGTARRRAGGGATVVLTALTLLAIPVVGVVLLHFGTDDGLPDIEFTPAPVVLAAQGRSVTDEHPGLVTLQWGDATSLVAPLWSGTVLETVVNPGDTIQPGDVVAVVDNIERIAWHTDRPFFRELGRGATGDDVSQLQLLLNTAGYYEGEVDGSYGGGTVAAVREWALDLGVEKPSGRFDPGWIVWLPDPRFEVAVVEITPGAAAPSPGTNILTAATPLVGAEFLTIDGEPFERGPGWVAGFESGQIPLGADGQIDSDALGNLEALLPSAEDEIPLTFKRSQPLDVVEVPATAIMTNDAGDTCVWVEQSADYQAVPVIVGSATARVVKVTGVPPDTPILANPGEVLELSACP